MSRTVYSSMSRRPRGVISKFASITVSIAMVFVSMSLVGIQAAQALFVGAGLQVSPSDLEFILKQIKISEHHSVALANDTTHAGGPCVGLLGTGPDQVPDIITSYGLRTVDGSCNNLIPGREKFGTADTLFPRLTTPVFNAAEQAGPFASIPGTPQPPAQTSYQQTTGAVVDSQPRTISNLIVDQTSANPAAVSAAAFPVRTQRAPGLFPCTTDPDPTLGIVGVPTGCVPSHTTLFIPNVTTDVGLSPPYNSLFTIFGQFFDHGLDKVTNGGSGTVFVPLNADDPLVAGPDHIFGNADDLPPQLRFMVLTRSTNQPGPDGVLGTADDIHEATNTDSPWVDLSQAYTSHPSHQVFLREYTLDATNHPHSTGRLLDSPDHSMANWGVVKAEAASKLGLQLVDTDVSNIPMIAADPYGNFIPDAVTGLADYVTTTGLVSGNLGTPVPVPANAIRINTAFLNDIARSAAPNGFPDADTVAGHQLDTPVCAPGQSPCYDDELLNLHVIAGDGRANENIALTTIHTIFEHEHNRLAVDEQNTLNANPAVLAAYQATNCVSGCATNNPGLPITYTYGERLFQAARFVTEMEYQHLVFEEYARKVQPAVRPFHVYSPDINPLITAEYAHAVFRFGHSQLDDTIPRINVDGSHNDIDLLDGFLNPAAFKDATAGAPDVGAAGAGAVVMGLSDQVGNELDEFVAETLRNHLLGLPLDLPALNMTRARAEGVPPLNEVRRQIFAKTNDGQLAPYANWIDFGQQLKHPESLINFVAAYGQHPSITGATTLADKRAAATLIVDPPMGTDPSLIPTDAFAFMNANGAWAGVETGINKVDLWVGGLAERQNLFGGLLGSTFNYVFENQLSNLQDGDRFYYLARTPGINLRTQLEGNTFAELAMRNTTATSLKADAFGTADCKFQLGSNPGIANILPNTNNVQDDPNSQCREDLLLIRMADGSVRYRTRNTVDPSGINGQSVYNGTAGADQVWGGIDNDTILGNDGNDVIQGNDGDDNVFGGNGNDIITDSSGADVLRGGPGNDAIDGGIGNDIVIGDTGNDFLNGGANDNEIFAGDGNDFVIAGEGADAVFGDSGDDWIEGGTGQDLLQGDSGAPFFDDPNAPGNDVLIGQPGENDYDAEGGDDIMMSFPAIERNAGAAGWDWVSGQYDTTPMDVDLNLSLIGIPLQTVVNRDRYQETEAVSGSPFDDHIVGDSVTPTSTGGAGFTGCDALDQAGIDRITGLSTLVPALVAGNPGVVPTAAVTAITFSQHCPLAGPFVWGAGNIILGGAGSDTIQGNGGDDIIDGDKHLNVRISVRTNPADPGTQVGTTDLMEHGDLTGNNFGLASPLNVTLQQAVFAGLLDPGNFVIVREIVADPPPAPGTPAAVDTAVFTNPAGLAGYTITANANGSVTVVDARPPVIGGAIGGAVVRSDGTDTLWNIEKLQFPDPNGGAPVVINAPVLLVNHPATGAPTLTTTAPATLAAPVVGIAINADPSTIVDLDGTINAAFIFQWLANGNAIAGASTSSFTPTAAQVGMPLTVVVSFTDNLGFNEHVTSVATGIVVAPAAPAITVGPTVLTANPATLVRAIGAPVSPQAITITNSGTANLTVTSAAVTGANAAAFPTVNGCTAPVIPTGTCTITVNFTSVAPAGARVATLTIVSDAATSPTAVSLNGTVVVNSAPTGTPAISDQTPTEGSAVTASAGTIADADGVPADPAAFTYQWQANSVGGGGAFVNIAGATAASFTPLQAQTNRRLRVVARFVDLHGTTQTVTSAGTTSVVGDLFPGVGDDNSGVNTLTGTGGDDVYAGGASNDSLTTGAGNDDVSGDAGDDTINTGAGDDTIRFNGTGDGFDAVAGGAGIDTIVAMSAGTVIGLTAINGVENITAGLFGGVGIQGSAGNNTLNFAGTVLTNIAYIDGGAGADNITGSAVADVIIGGAGNDTLTGGAGADVFRYGPGGGFGADRITDFAVGTDKIDLSLLGITAANFSTLVGKTNAAGGSTLITIGGGTIRLLGIPVAATVTVSDFILAP